MCGIFAYIGDQQNAGQLILEGLKSLEYRGYDSWGVALKKQDKEVFIEKHVGKIGEATLPAFTTTAGIGHTRWATHGGVTEANAHPHVDCTGKVIVVHNGIVENFAELKEKLQKNGHTFKSETDSEVLAHLIEEEMKTTHDLKQVMLQMFRKIEGMSSVIAFFPETEEFYTIKNGSPLVVGSHEHGQILASDASAILPHTKNVYFMQDDELLHINRASHHLFDDQGNPKEMKFTTITYDLEDAQMGDYKHFMIKEIHEQPKVLLNILTTQKESLEKAAAMIKESYGTYFIGCGTAAYACLAGTYIFSKVAKRHVNFSIASEFNYLLDFLKDTSLIIPLSQSGETIDIISSMKEAKEKYTRIMAVTNTIGSTLYRLADYSVLLNAGPEKAVASTKAFTAKIAILYLLAHILNGTFEQGVKDLEKAVGEVKKLLSIHEDINALAKKLKDAPNIFTLGRGVSYPAALEAALKIKEVSYTHAEGFAGGELKHGVMALIEEGTPVIIFNPEDETYADTLSSAHEVKARGAYVIGVSSKHDPVYDHYIEVEHAGDVTLIPNVVVAQLIGYYLSLEKGYDPDKPRNLAKSVTVK